MATFLHILYVIYVVAKAIVLSFLFFVILYSIGYIASMFIGLLFWKKERDPRIKPFWRNIGKKGSLRDQE
jgi:hypothetical protein